MMGRLLYSIKVCRGRQIVKLIIRATTFDLTTPTNCHLKILPQYWHFIVEQFCDFSTKFNSYLHSELHGQQSCPQSQCIQLSSWAIFANSNSLTNLISSESKNKLLRLIISVIIYLVNHCEQLLKLVNIFLS